jgi:hypothetical protein
MLDRKKKKHILDKCISALVYLLVMVGLSIPGFQKWLVGFAVIGVIARIIYDLATIKTRPDGIDIIQYLLLIAFTLVMAGSIWPLRGIPLLLGLLIWSVLIAMALMPFIKEGLMHLAISYKEMSRKDRDQIHS